ncbi:MAG: hypothetical protein IPP81_11675 [Chitinophagaceae bacterium]|nr:hypothetical protein [Chitinophagaceae bacterium]
MSKSKVISIRVPMERYDEIVLQAAYEKIKVTEWMERRLALMNVLQREKEDFLNYLHRTENRLKIKGVIDGDPVLLRARAFANIIP